MIKRVKRAIGFHAFSEIKHAYVMTLFALLPVLIVMVILQFTIVVNEQNYIVNIKVSNIAVLQYMMISIIHIIICSSVFYTIFKNIKVISVQKEKVLIGHVVFLTILVSLFFIIILLKTNTNLEILSHDIVYKSFISVNEVSILFKTARISYLNIDFYYFSLFPVITVCFAFFATISVIFEISVYSEKLYKLDVANCNLKDSIDIFDATKNSLIKLIIILTSGSYSTAVYFSASIKNNNISFANYAELAHSMSLAWGAIFTLTLTSILLYPIYRHYDDVLIIYNRSDKEKYNKLIFQRKIQYLASLISPIIGAYFGYFHL